MLEIVGDHFFSDNLSESGCPYLGGWVTIFLMMGDHSSDDG